MMIFGVVERKNGPPPLNAWCTYTVFLKMGGVKRNLVKCFFRIESHFFSCVFRLLRLVLSHESKSYSERRRC